MKKGKATSKVNQLDVDPIERIYLHPVDVAKIIGISYPTVWKWLKEGKLPKPTFQSKGTTLWKKQDVLDYIDNGGKYATKEQGDNNE